MKVNPNNLNFIDDVAKQIFVSGLNEKFATPEQFKSLASNSYHLATVLASQRDDFMKTQNLQNLQNLQNIQNIQEKQEESESFSLHTPSASAFSNMAEPRAKVHKVKVERAEKIEKLEKLEKSEKSERSADKVVDVFETQMRSVASSNETGDVVQKRKRGRPPKAKTEATVTPKAKRK